VDRRAQDRRRAAARQGRSASLLARSLARAFATIRAGHRHRACEHHPQVKEAFDKLAQAQTRISTKVNEARQDADKRRSNAEAEAFKLDRSAKAYAREERIKAIAEADSFQKRLAQYRELSARNPDYLNAVWLDQVTRIFLRMKEGGRIDLLDLTSDLNITQFPLTPKKK
jgi:hypothetical protein